MDIKYTIDTIPEFFVFEIKSSFTKVNFHATNLKERGTNERVYVGWFLEGQGMSTHYPLDIVLECLNTGSWIILK